MEQFENPEFGTIRTTLVNEAPYFVGKDVADILSYSNPRKALKDHAAPEDKEVTKCYTLGGEQELTVINESGLYSLILSSKLPSAKRFKHWVTSEVLPSIRKHGAYATEITIDKMVADPDFAIRLLSELKAERAAKAELAAKVEQQDQQLIEAAPKLTYYDVVLQSKDVVPVTIIAKDYGVGAPTMNRWLADRAVQYKQNDVWLLYHKYQDRGYTASKTHVHSGNDGEMHSTVHTYWTQKGRRFIYELLKTDGILPLIEQEKTHEGTDKN